MDLVHEEDVPLVEVGEHGHQVPGLFDGGAGGDAHVHAHLVGDDGGQGGLAQARGPVEQHVVQGLVTQLCGIDEDLQIALGLLLADVLGEGTGPEGAFGVILGQACRGGQHLAGLFGKIDTQLNHLPNWRPLRGSCPRSGLRGCPSPTDLTEGRGFSPTAPVLTLGHLPHRGRLSKHSTFTNSFSFQDL